MQKTIMLSVLTISLAAVGFLVQRNILNDDQLHSISSIDNSASQSDEQLLTPSSAIISPKSIDSTIDANSLEVAAVTESPALHDLNEQVEQGLDYIESLKEIPGARELVEEVVVALEENPNLIRTDIFQNPEGVTVDAAMIEKMIPDAEFRHKWMKLMQLVKQHYQQALKDSPSK